METKAVMVIVEHKRRWDHLGFIMLILTLSGELKVCNAETLRQMTNIDGPKYGPVLKNLQKIVIKKREICSHRKYITFGSFC